MRGGGGRGRRKDGDGHLGDGGGGDEQQQGGGGEDGRGRVVVHRPLQLPEEEEDDEEELNDVVEVGAEDDDVEEQQGRRGGDIGEAAQVAQEGGAGEEEALVPILNLPPIDSLPPFSLASEADLLLLLHGSSPQSCKIRKGKSICSEEGGCESRGGGKCVMAKMKQSWLEKGLPLKEPDTSILRVISKVKERFKKLRKNEKRMGLEEKQGHSAALKAVTVNLAPADYKQVITARWELPAVAKKSLLDVLDDYVGKEATRFDFHSQQ